MKSHIGGVSSVLFSRSSEQPFYAVLHSEQRVSLPVVLIAAAAAAIIFTIVKYWDEIKDFFIAIWDWCVELGETIWGGLESGWETVTG